MRTNCNCDLFDCGRCADYESCTKANHWPYVQPGMMYEGFIIRRDLPYNLHDGDIIEDVYSDENNRKFVEDYFTSEMRPYNQFRDGRIWDAWPDRREVDKEREILLEIGRCKAKIHEITAKDHALSPFWLSEIDGYIRTIRENMKWQKEIHKTDRAVLQRYEDFVRWEHGSEDGDYIFMQMREDELRNAKERQRRIQRRERRLKK